MVCMGWILRMAGAGRANATIVDQVHGSELTLHGRLDARSASAVREHLHRAVDAGRGDLLVHAGGLEIFDATGLGVLVGAHRRAVQRGRRLVLHGLPGRQVRLLRAARLHRTLCLAPLQV